MTPTDYNLQLTHRRENTKSRSHRPMCPQIAEICSKSHAWSVTSSTMTVYEQNPLLPFTTTAASGRQVCAALDEHVSKAIPLVVTRAGRSSHVSGN